MSVKNLSSFFKPQSIALIGASPRPGSVGATVLANLMTAGFDGPVWLVNPRHDHVGPHPCHASIADLPGVPELGIVAAPAKYVPDTVEELGKRGALAVLIITAGLGKGPGSLAEEAGRIARHYGMRIVGPNCLGLLVPPAGLNASFSHVMPGDGDLVFLSQSGALVTAVVDWAASRGIGFRAVVSLGDMLDVDVGDLLDYFASDVRTRAILLYLESINEARGFMSAARLASRLKPVVAIKAGRNASAAEAAASHTGALAASDIVFDAALRRAGVLRVFSLDELFTAAETLNHVKPFRGERLAIVTNGGGAGVLAADALEDRNGKLATLSAGTMATLDAALPETWSHGNPVDVIGDAPPERYAAAVAAVMRDPNVDAVMAMNCPTALASVTDAAEASLKAWKESGVFKPLFGCWLGDGGATEARRLLAAGGVPSYQTPTSAIEGFRHIVDYSKVQELLIRTPPAGDGVRRPQKELARKIVETALSTGRTMLTSDEAKMVLAAYHVPVALAEPAADPDEAAEIAAEILGHEAGVVLKIRSQDISHKSDVGGVRLGLRSADETRAAARTMLETARRVKPDARIDGFTVEPMVSRAHGIELITGIATDPLFGPIVLFGAGGTAVEVLADRTVGLPPLDRLIARDMIEETNVSKLLAGYRDRPAANIDAIVDSLIALSRILVDIPELSELDINPLTADEHGVIALDARIRLDPKAAGVVPGHNFAIRPYPDNWISRETTSGDLDVAVRPVKPEDEPLYGRFFDRLDPEDIRLRFFTPIKELSHRFVARLTQIDYDRSMAFCALTPGDTELLGISHLILDADREVGEYAVAVRSDLKGRGIGWLLMQKLIAFAVSEGVKTIHGDVLAANTTMLQMCRELGFEVERHPQEAGVVLVTLQVSADRQRELGAGMA